ncbi:helix-turn-helix transcriptional regulator [Nocardioides sp. GCM10030258]|uniref:helix-turn-helix transcriptional regulator n=1 Tax=unclassified Nocardioides TaxID=2615069 RepID=UPI0036183573
MTDLLDLAATSTSPTIAVTLALDAPLPMPSVQTFPMASSARRGDVATERDSEAEFPLTAIVEVSLQDHPNYRIHPTMHDLVAKMFQGRGPVMAQGPNAIKVVFGVIGPDLVTAQEDALTTAREVLAVLNLPDSPLNSLKLCRQQYSEEFGSPVLVGLRELAAILGVSKQRALQLTQRDDFPPPIQRLRATPVWIESEVRGYATTRRTLRAN